MRQARPRRTLGRGRRALKAGGHPSGGASGKGVAAYSRLSCGVGGDRRAAAHYIIDGRPYFAE